MLCSSLSGDIQMEMKKKKKGKKKKITAVIRLIIFTLL